jgi:signal transduction histidine kinase
LTAISTHRAASAVGALLIVVHVLLAVLDPWIELSWVSALVPGASGWETWGIALSALAVDLLLVLLLTTATRRWAPRAWRRVHLVAYPVWALAVGHGLLVGTDGAVMRGLALISLALVLAAVSVRLLARPVVPRPIGGSVDLVGGGVR